MRYTDTRCSHCYMVGYVHSPTCPKYKPRPKRPKAPAEFTEKERRAFERTWPRLKRLGAASAEVFAAIKSLSPKQQATVLVHALQAAGFNARKMRSQISMIRRLRDALGDDTP